MLNHRRSIAGGRRLVLLAGLIAWCALAMTGCSGSGSPGGTEAADRVGLIGDARQPAPRRAEAVRAHWSGLRAEDKPDEARAMRDLYWRGDTPAEMRLAIVDVLGTDPDVREDAESLFRLALPHEADREVIDRAAAIIADQGWDELSTTLVRTLARSRSDEPDASRSEAEALMRLHPNRSLVQIVFVEFLQPTVNAEDQASMRGVDLRRRFRTDAWDLLARLDPGGNERRTLLGEVPPDLDPMVEAISRVVRTFGVLPETGLEIRWAETMAGGSEAQREWWGAAESAFGSLSEGQRRGFAMRHIEPVRWAADRRPEWISMGRSELYAELDSRLRGRQTYTRTATRTHNDGPNREKLSDWRDRLVWGDLLAILIADQAVGSERVRRLLYSQAEADRADTTTEYGGTLDADGERFGAQLYTPRPSERQGDRVFVASEDMVTNSPRSLAHYHMHVQRPSQGAYAGPGRDDLIYAARSGRTCMVFTSVERGGLNADIYFPHGAVVDLGLVAD